MSKAGCYLMAVNAAKNYNNNYQLNDIECKKIQKACAIIDKTVAEGLFGVSDVFIDEQKYLVIALQCMDYLEFGRFGEDPFFTAIRYFDKLTFSTEKDNTGAITIHLSTKRLWV